MVDIYNRRVACAQVPEVLRAGALAVAPLNRLAMLADFLPPAQRSVPCPDQDAVHGMGVLALDVSPVVVQVPDFGQRFWAYHVLDLRGDRFARLGRVHATRPGFYLLAGPRWDGDVPRGIAGVFRSTTATGIVAPRVFQDESPEDNNAAQRALGEVAMYPVHEFDGRVKRRDWSKLRDAPAEIAGAAEPPRFVPERFVEQLAATLADAPALRGEEARYAQVLAAVEAARTDARIRLAMIEGARDAHERLVKPLAQFRSHGLRLAHHWSAIANAAAFGTDYFVRTASARSDLLAGAVDEVKHFRQDLDADGERLNSAHRYTLTFTRAAAPPVSAFWSLAIYDEQHYFAANSIDRFSVGTRTRDLRIAADGSLTLFIQSSMPMDAALDGTWTPPPVMRLTG